MVSSLGISLALQRSILIAFPASKDEVRKQFGRVYFVSVDYNSITGLTTETFSQTFSMCAAVAAAPGALRAAGLGTAATRTGAGLVSTYGFLS